MVVPGARPMYTLPPIMLIGVIPISCGAVTTATLESKRTGSGIYVSRIYVFIKRKKTVNSHRTIYHVLHGG
jgi:hypothetical protein